MSYILAAGNGYQQIWPTGGNADKHDRQFVLCDLCFWSATLLYKHKASCPSCPNSTVSLIPLAKDEEYSIKVSHSGGLELEFLRADRK